MGANVMPGKNLLGQCGANQDCALDFSTLTMTFSATGTASITRAGTPTGGGTQSWSTTASGSVTLARQPYKSTAGNADAGNFQVGQYQCCCSCRWGILPPVANQVSGVPWEIALPFTGTTTETSTFPGGTSTSTPYSGTVVFLPNIVNVSGVAGQALILVGDASQACREISGTPLPVAGNAAVGAFAGSRGANLLGGFPDTWDDPFLAGNHVDVSIKVDGIVEAAFTVSNNWIGIYGADGSAVVIGAIDPCSDNQDHIFTVTSSSSFALISQPGIGAGTATSSLLVQAEITLG